MLSQKVVMKFLLSFYIFILVGLNQLLVLEKECSLVSTYTKAHFHLGSRESLYTNKDVLLNKPSSLENKKNLSDLKEENETKKFSKTLKKKCSYVNHSYLWYFHSSLFGKPLSHTFCLRRFILYCILRI